MYTDSQFLEYLNLRAINSIRDIPVDPPQGVDAPEGMQLKMSPSISGDTGGATAARVEYDRKQLDKQQQAPSRLQYLFDEINRIRDEFVDLVPRSPQEVDPQLSPEAGYGADAGTFTGERATVASLGNTQLPLGAFQPIRQPKQQTTGFEAAAEESRRSRAAGVVAGIAPAPSDEKIGEWKPSTPRDYYRLGVENVFKSIGLSDRSASNMAANLIGVEGESIGLADVEPFSLAAEGGRAMARGIRDDDKMEMLFGLLDVATAVFPPAKALKTAKSKEAAKAFDAKMEQLGYKKIEPTMNPDGSIIGNSGRQPDPMSITTRGDAVGNLIEGYEPSGRLNVNSKLKGIISANESGKLDDAGFKQAVSNLQTEIANRQVHKAAQYIEPARGHDSLVSKLRDDVRKGRVTREAADMVEWVSLKNPNLAQNLAASSNKKLIPDGASGVYLSGEQMMVYRGAQNALDLMRGGAAEAGTPVHEFLHHTERLLPQDIRDGIAQLWWKRTSDHLLQAIKSGDDELVDYLSLSMSGDTQKAANKFISMHRKDAGTLYQYVNASEFWAENGSKIMRSRSVGDLGNKAGSYYRELTEKMKDTVGASSDNAVYKAVRGLKTASADAYGKPMSESKITAPTGITKGEKVAAGAAAAVTSSAVAGKVVYDARDRRMQERAEGK